MGKAVKAAANLLDGTASSLSTMLRQYPLSRLAILLYLFFIHAYIYYLLGGARHKLANLQLLIQLRALTCPPFEHVVLLHAKHLHVTPGELIPPDRVLACAFVRMQAGCSAWSRTSRWRRHVRWRSHTTAWAWASMHAASRKGRVTAGLAPQALLLLQRLPLLGSAAARPLE